MECNVSNFRKSIGELTLGANEVKMQIVLPAEEMQSDAPGSMHRLLID